MRVGLALLVLGTLAHGCSFRDRANPFDPHNPQTGGRPAGFVALAANGRVDLRWQAVSGDGLIGYQIFRRASPGTDFQPLSSVLPPSTSLYRDYGLLNGLDHTYRIFYVFDIGYGGQPAEDTATPGTPIPWSVDAAVGALDRITPDGRHVAERRSSFVGPTAVGVDSILGLVWVSDATSGQVTILDSATGVSTVIPGFSSPGGIGVSSIDGSAWVCDETGGRVHHFSSSGHPLHAPVEPIDRPTSVAVDGSDGSAWICERGGGRILRRRANGTAIWAVSVPAPSRIALNRSEAWVTSFTTGTLRRIDSLGTVTHTYNFLSGPIGVAVDVRRSHVWVADADGGQLVRLRLDGSVDVVVPDLESVREVAVDIESGEAWAVLPDRGEIVRVSPSGQILRRLGGFEAPFAIAVDPGGRR